MSETSKYNFLKWHEKFLLNIIKCGSVPKHIAFIMDGNRRFAKKSGFNIKSGHYKGTKKFKQILKWSLELGVEEITVYLLSVDNLKRNPAELSNLMDILQKGCRSLRDEEERWFTDNICVRVAGNLQLLPVHIRKGIAETVKYTKDNNKMFLNVALAYSSREEIKNAVQTVINGVSSNQLEIDDIDECLLSHCMYTNFKQNPDILVRTSGETRLSDFLLWQIQYTRIFFPDVLWPEISVIDLFIIVLKYQSYYRALSTDTAPAFCKHQHSIRVSHFLKDVENERMCAVLNEEMQETCSNK